MTTEEYKLCEGHISIPQPSVTIQEFLDAASGEHSASFNNIFNYIACMTEFVGGRKDNCRDLLYGTSPVHA
jgi:hypothetical protein